MQAFSAPVPATDKGLKEADLDGMTKNQLLDYAETIDVVGLNSRMTKAEIITAIRGD